MISRFAKDCTLWDLSYEVHVGTQSSVFLILEIGKVKNKGNP
jgi:hypothetical protein